MLRHSNPQVPLCRPFHIRQLVEYLRKCGPVRTLSALPDLTRSTDSRLGYVVRPSVRTLLEWPGASRESCQAPDSANVADTDSLLQTLHHVRHRSASKSRLQDP